MIRSSELFIPDRIPDPEFLPIPDPEAKKEPDPGSETLLGGTFKKEYKPYRVLLFLLAGVEGAQGLGAGSLTSVAGTGAGEVLLPRKS